MLIYAGIDEAGYGPMLGPLTVGCSWFALPDDVLPESGRAPNLWTLMRTAVAKNIKTAKGRVPVADSKKLKGSNAAEAKKHPLFHLERGVLAFLPDPGVRACVDDISLFKALRPEWTDAAIAEMPWYCTQRTPLPVGSDISELGITANVVRNAMKRRGFIDHGMACEFMFAPEFNERCDQLRSKAAASFMLVGQHIGRLFAEYGEHNLHLVIDRQGGRQLYRDPLQTLFPESKIRIHDERDGLSRYELRDGSRRMVISFQESAESKHLPVALASMVAKYVRELWMIRFNRMFNRVMPEVKPTAGYVQDARRFLHDVEPVLAGERLDRRAFIRRV